MRSGMRWTGIASFLLPVILLPAGCSRSVPIAPGSESVPGLEYGESREVSRLEDPRIDESSGIARSIRYRNAFWTHNDSGDTARIFLVGADGRTRATVGLRGASAVDWEDIASYGLGDESYVMVADVGDNARRRSGLDLYVVRESGLDIPPGGDGAPGIEIEPDCHIRFSFEDGPHDCEAVAVDPTESAIYLVAKDAGEGGVYSMPLPPGGSGEPSIARRVASIPVGYATAMDISPDGRRAVVLTYGDAFEFARGGGETWARAFSREPRLIRTPKRPQGEAVCYGPDGRTLYLTSENAHQPLWEIPVVGNP